MFLPCGIRFWGVVNFVWDFFFVQFFEVLPFSPIVQIEPSWWRSIWSRAHLISSVCRDRLKDSVSWSSLGRGGYALLICSILGIIELFVRIRASRHGCDVAVPLILSLDGVSRINYSSFDLIFEHHRFSGDFEDDLSMESGFKEINQVTNPW